MFARLTEKGLIHDALKEPWEATRNPKQEFRNIDRDSAIRNPKQEF